MLLTFSAQMISIKKIACLILVIDAVLLVDYANAEPCLFDFERDEELGDFDMNCGGSNWNETTLVIVDKPVTAEPPEDLKDEVGDKGLTVLKEKQSCMVSYQTIALKSTQSIEILYFVRKKTSSGYGSLSLILECGASSPEPWVLLGESDTDPEGNWFKLSHTFSLLHGTSCKVKIDIYKNNDFEIYIDKIEIVDPVSAPEECYKVPRPVITTTELDTTTCSSSEGTSEQTATSTDSSTNSDGSNTSEQTTVIESEEDTTTTAEEGTTTTSESTRPDETEENTTSTSGDGSTTAENTEGQPAESTTTEITEESTVSESSEIPAGSTTTGSTEGPAESTASESTTGGETTWSRSTISRTSDGPSSQPTLRPPTYPQYSSYFFVIIIAVSCAMSFISLCLCLFLHRNRNSSKKRAKHKYVQQGPYFYS